MPDAANVRPATRKAPEDAASSPRADLLFDAFFSGALGGSAIALFFLVIDMVEGRPLFTPSLIGTTLFTGADPASMSAVRLDMVAYFSVVHFAAFFVLGLAISRLCAASIMVQQHPAIMAGTVFVILTATLFAGDVLLMRGVISAIGIGWVLAANLVTGGVMAWFVRRAHRRG